MGRQSFIRVLQAVAIAAVLACAGPVAHAQVTWTGTTSTSWSGTSNWSTLAVPPPGAFLFFSSGASANTTSNNDLSGLSLSGLTFLDNTFTGPLTLSGNALTLSATTTTSVNFARTSPSTTVTVTQSNHGLITGQWVTVATGSSNFNGITNSNGIVQVTVVTGSTFTYVSGSNANGTLTGTYTPATINNLNTTAGREVTIANNLSISNAQVWASAASANAITTISGNLSGSGNLTIAGGVASNTTSQQPNFRLTGNNSLYTGTIGFVNNNAHGGVLLGGTGAMTGGLIDLSNPGTSGNTTAKNLWLTGGSGTYTFRISGTADTSGPRVLFSRVNSSNRSGGILLTGGDVYWNPGGGPSYVWSGGNASSTNIGENIQVGGGVNPNTSLPYRLFLGQESGTFSISGGNKNIGPGGSNAAGSLDGRVTLLSALGSGTDSTARTLEVGVPVLTLSAPAVTQTGTLNVTVGGNTAWTTGITAGLEISNLNQLPNGNLTLGSGAATNGSVLILKNTGTTFNRVYGPEAGQWQISGANNSGTATWAGFAATGSDATIPNTDSGTSAFDRNFALGYGLRNPDGTLYADKGVTIAQNTTLTDTRLVTVANNGMDRFGMSGTAGPNLPGPNVLNALSGTLSGNGAIVVLGQGDNPVRGILTLSGSNLWTGAPISSQAFLSGSTFFNAGPGGLIAKQSFVRFARPESLPTGATSGTSYIAAIGNLHAGLLFTGGGTTNVDYDLSPNYRFLFGQPSNAQTVTNAVTTFVADGGKVTVKGSSLLLNLAATTSGTHNSSFNVFQGSELTLGSGTESFNLIPTTGSSSASASTTDYTTATTGVRWLYKLGEGTLVLGNVRYTDTALTGTTQQSLFRWQIGGSGTSSRTGVPEGPVRGLSMSSTAANPSNSLQGFFVQLAGGVYEVDNRLETSGTLTVAAIGSTQSGTNTTFSWLSGGGGGGFSAYGNDVAVSLPMTIQNSGTGTRWDSVSFGLNGAPLIFGSQTADRVITLTTNLDFYTNSGATREIRVLDNPDTSSDYAVISGMLVNHESAASRWGNFNKTGPGLLELRAANTFTGTATVSEGTLLLANNLALQNAWLNTSGTGLVAMSEIVTTPTFGGLVGDRNLSTVFDSSYSTLAGITFNRVTGTSTYTGAIADGATGMAVTKSGVGVQELTGANSYTGLTTINAGTLRLGVANLPGNIAIANGAGLEILQGGATTGTASGVISGTGSLTMINGGVVRLANAANTYTGATTISSGVLEVAALANAGSDSPLGAPTGGNATIVLGSSTTSGTLNYVGSGAASTNRSFNLLGNGGIAANGGGALAITGTVTDAGAQVFTLSGTSTALNSLPSINGGSGVSVIKSGPGTWQLTGQSTYGGGLTVLNGTLIAAANRVGSNSPFGGNLTAAVIGDATAASGTAALLLASGVTIDQSITVASGVGQQVELGGIGSGTFASSQIILGRNVTLRAATGSTVTFLPTWVLPSGTSPTVGFTIGSSTNAGTVVFGSGVASSVVNAVNVVAGTLQIDVNNRMGFGIPLTLGSASSNGTFDLRSFSQRLASLTFTGVGSTVSSTAAGTLRLFNGGTAAANVNVLGTGVAHQISAPVALDDNSTFNVASAAKLAVSGLISNGTNGARDLTKTGLGTLELSGANNTYTGNTLIEEGTLVIGADNAISGSSAITIGTAGSRGFLKLGHNLTISSLTFTGQGGDIVDPSSGTATFSSTTGTAVISVLGGTNEFHANATLSSPTVVNVADGALFTFHNNISGSSSLTKSGSGIMQLVGDNELFSGSFFITGGQVNIGAGMRQIGSGTTTLSNGAILNLNGQSFTNFIDSSGGFIINNGGTSTTTITGPTLVSSTAALLGTYEITSTGSARFEGVVGNGSSQVTVRVNTGTGSGGRAVFAEAVSGSANITVESGGLATFGSTVSGYVISHGASTFNGSLLSGGQVDVNTGGSAVFTGTAALGSIVNVNADGVAEFRSAVGGITRVTGSALFTSAAGLTGVLDIEPSSGVATLDNVVGSAITGEIHNDGTLNIVRSTGSETISAVIDGSGSLVKQGAGLVALTGNNSPFGGVTTISGGTLSIGNGGASGSLGGSITNNAALVFNRSDASSFAGTISGSGSLTKQGAGQLTLTGSSNFTGLTTVSAGTLSIGGGGTTGSIAGNIDNSGAVVFNRSDAVTYAGIISGNGSLTKRGGDKLTLTGNNNALSGLTTVEQGSLAVNGLLGPGGLSVLAGATLMGSGTIGGDATIAGIHSPGNSPGIETFSGNLTYAGGLSQVIWELWNNTDAAGSRGTAYDGIDVTGTLNFDGATSLILSFGGSGTGSVDWESSFWSESKEWLLYSVSGTTTNFSNFTLSSNPSSWIDSTGTSFASSTRSGGSFQVVQQGSNILLQYVVVPEPAAITLAFIGIAAAAYAARRRR